MKKNDFLGFYKNFENLGFLKMVFNIFEDQKMVHKKWFLSILKMGFKNVDGLFLYILMIYKEIPK